MQLLAMFCLLFFVLGTVQAYQEETQEIYTPAKLFLIKRTVVLPQKVYVANNDESTNWFTTGYSLKDATKRALPMSGGIYGKRSVPLDTDENEEQQVVSIKRTVLPFSGGIYGKRSATVRVPFSGGIYGKRSITLRSLPMSGGIYG